MGTEVLRPQDCLAKRFHLSPSSFHHRPKYSPATGNGRGFTGNNHLHRNSTNYGYRNPAVARPVQKKKPQHLASFDNFKVASKHTKNNLNQNNNNNGIFSQENPSHVEYEKITILRRGASLDSINEKIKKDHNNNKISNNLMYAGSAFSVSPPPSDLPLPTFFKKHQSFDDSASRGLRRLLRLE